MIRNNTLNPLSIFDVRQSNTAQPHFVYMNIPVRYNVEQSLIRWISSNMKNKFYIGRNLILDTDNTITAVITIGFEEHKDLSYFVLACPLLKYTK